MLFIVSFLLFRQKAFFGLPTGKPNKKKARHHDEPFQPKKNHYY